LTGCKAVRDPNGAQQTSRLNPFSVLRVRRIDCRDGPALCCVCSNPGCPRSKEEKESLEDEMRHPDQLHRTRAQIFKSAQPLCRCATSALSAEFSSVGSFEDDAEHSFCAWYLHQDPFGAI